MQVAVRLGRKAGDHLLDAAGVEVGLNDVANEIAAGLAGRRPSRLPFRPRHASSLPIRLDAAYVGGPHDVALRSMSIALSSMPNMVPIG